MKFNPKSFTLIELLIVLVLLGVLAAVSVPNFGQTYFGVLVKKSAEDLAYSIRYGQSRAVLKGQIVRLNCNTSEQSYWLEDQMTTDNAIAGEQPQFQKIAGRFGRTYRMPGDVVLECPGEFIQFLPSGDIDKMRLTVSLKDKTWIVSTADQKNHVLVYLESQE